MEIRKGVGAFLTKVLEEFRLHPLFLPYLNTSKDEPLTHYLHQCELLARLALRRPVRVFIADEIGLGKTVSALLLAKYLKETRRARRILIVVPRILVLQWIRELKRAGISPHRLERSDIEGYVKEGFPEGYYITSMDLIKKEDLAPKIREVEWDLVIVDEAHRLTRYGGVRKTKRFEEIGEGLIAGNSLRNILFLSATPHRGDPRDYISRLKLLDPHLLDDKKLDSSQFYERTHGAILFRRTKEDVNNIYENRRVFRDAKFYAALISASYEEKRFARDLVEFLRSKLRDFAEMGKLSYGVIPLLVTLIFKRASSSPWAALLTMGRLLSKRAPGASGEIPEWLIEKAEALFGATYDEYEEDSDRLLDEFLNYVSPITSERDREKIRELYKLAEAITREGDSKLRALFSLLDCLLREDDLKVIIFTEYKDTLDYIEKALRERFGEGVVVALSSDIVRSEKSEKLENIREKFEKDPRTRILIATDVAAEGLNLQVASVLINYEIPWSLIRLEQRIGRVWRLGQKRDVEVYTLFMDNEVDKDALEAMYKKLLNLRMAALDAKPIMGQELLLYAESSNISDIPQPVIFEKKGRKGKFVNLSEAKLVKTYIEEGRKGLEEIVNAILEARRVIEYELRKKKVLYKVSSRKDVEEALTALGFRSHVEVIESLKGLLKASATFLGIEYEEGDELRAWRKGSMPVILNALDHFYAFMAGEGGADGVISIVANGNGSNRIALIPVRVRAEDGALLYAELVGVDMVSGKLYRGASLLSKISEVISNIIGVDVPEGAIITKEGNAWLSLKAKIRNELRAQMGKNLKPLRYYRQELCDLGLRDCTDKWLDSLESAKIELLDPISYIRFVKLGREPPEEVKREIEERAIAIVMEVEQREGRIPQRMSKYAHYDIKSTDPATGEERIIEVKGHWEPEIYAELTESEAEEAEREGDRYWLYIVYDIGSNEPKWLRFRNPLRTMNLRVLERVQRRYILRPGR